MNRAAKRFGLLLLTVAFAAALASPCAAQRPDYHEQLVKLIDQYPSRVFGSADNEQLTQSIIAMFMDATAKGNAQSIIRVREAERTWQEADIALQHVFELKRRQEQQALAGITVTSPWYVRFTVEQPGVTIGAFAMLLILAGGCWRAQRRNSLLVMAVVCAAVIIILPVVAATVETNSERSTRQAASGDSGSVMTVEAHDKVVREAQVAALEADRKASNKMALLWQSGTLTKPTAAFVPGPAWLEVDGKAKLRIYQMAPNLVEPANLPEEGFTGPLLYAGTGREADLRAIADQTDPEAKQAILLDFNSSKRWINAVRNGADVILFIEPEPDAATTRGQASQKFTVSPLSIPRFYIRRRELEAAFGADWRAAVARDAPNIRITQPVTGKWQRRNLIIPWLLIPGTAPSARAGTKVERDPSRQLIHLQTYIDSNSIVPELAPGANSASNIVLMKRLLARFSAPGGRPVRPVLISFTNNHADLLLGEAEYAHFAFAEPGGLRDELDNLEKHLSHERFILKTYVPPTAEGVAHMRTHVATVAGKKIKIKQPILDLLARKRNMGTLERGQLIQRLKEPKEATVEEHARLKSNVDQIDQRLQQIERLMRLFNQFGKKILYKDLSADDTGVLAVYFNEIHSRARRDQATLLDTHRSLIKNLALRRRLRYLTDRDEQFTAKLGYKALAARQFPALPATTGLCLDLSFSTDRIGFFYVGYPSDNKMAADRTLQLGKQTVNLAAELASRIKGINHNPFVDTITNARSLSWQTHMGGYLMLASSTFHDMFKCALTLTSVQDFRPHAFSPFDTADRIDRRNFNDVMYFSEEFLATLINEPDLGLWPKEVPAPQAIKIQANEFYALLQDQFSTDIPKRPLPDALAVRVQPGYRGVSTPQNFLMYGQVRTHSVSITDDRGLAMLRGGMGSLYQVYGYDPEYRNMLYARDRGDGMRFFPTPTAPPPGTHVQELKMALAELQKIDLVGLIRPLTLVPVNGIRVLDATRDNTPDHWSLTGVSQSSVGLGKDSLAKSMLHPMSNDGTASIMVPRDTRFKLQLEGAIAINITDDAPDKGKGFPADIGIIHDMAQTSLQDMLKITERRMRMLASKGVTDSLVHRLIDSALKVESDSELDKLARIEEARGYSFRAYTRGRQIINDLIVAVVVFMALVIPFCFFVMKLVTPFTEVTRQLTIFGLIFLLMVAVLYWVHPAFSVANTPVIVIMAFVILGLAVFVAMILISRFNSSMMELVEQALQSEAVDAAQSRLVEAAFLVGVNNMKRRRIRTSLTCATIVLVTFTMLSVISVGQDVDPAMVRQSATAAYDGFVFLQPGMGKIETVQMDRLRARYGRGTVTVTRAWGQMVDHQGHNLPLRITQKRSPDAPREVLGERVIESKVLLGMEQAEHGFIADMPLVKGRWIRDGQAEIVLSVEAADLIGITPENFNDQTLILLGMEMTLVGLVDDQKLARMQDLAETPILPMVFNVTAAQAAPGTAQQRNEDMAKELGGGNKLLEGGEISGRPFDPINIAIVPIEMAQQLGFASYRSLSVKFIDDQQLTTPPAQRAWNEVNRLIRFQHQRNLLGLTRPVERDPESQAKISPGEYALTSSTTTQVGGVLKAAIPTILAATIILNTMLGSVMERKREVSIYNAIGLNPGHVIMFFLAESLVFGLVGAVGGYLIGQTLSIVINWLDLIKLNLNYSSMAVIVVIFLTIATVLASTIYPALMAARAAVPSGQRRWSLPRPEGDHIHIEFPFSYDSNHVLGVCAYLHEFMQQNSEASTGKFLARAGPVGLVPAHSAPDNAENPTAYAMLFDIAPAPFDLGVNQKMEVYCAYNTRIRSHMLSVHLTRLSGEHSSWVTVNQPFLESLRKRLLAWRSQPAEIQNGYHDRGKQMFRAVTLLPSCAPEGKST